MLGVGAVFLYMAGTIKKGPEFLKRLGLRWVLRIIQEPKRLFLSTLPSIFFFIKLVAIEIFTLTKWKSE
jgi:N-acetylglucosaminyldiphosphoundecaprenol N-acetyl-beta-D-mannosaminyltransferase